MKLKGIRLATNTTLKQLKPKSNVLTYLHGLTNIPHDNDKCHANWNQSKLQARVHL